MRSFRLLPFIVLAFGFFSLGIASLILLLPNLQTYDQNTSYASNDCVKPVEVDLATPVIELTDLGKNEVEISDYLGEVVLLNTWATWCPPCKAEMPDLQTFYEKYKDQGFTIIGVNIGESNEQVLTFAVENQLTFPLWLDPDEQSLRALNTISLPYSIVINRDGIVRYAWSGATCKDALEQTIAPIITQ